MKNQPWTVASVLHALAHGSKEERREIAEKFPLFVTGVGQPSAIVRAAFHALPAMALEAQLDQEQEEVQSGEKTPVHIQIDDTLFKQYAAVGAAMSGQGRQLKTQPVIAPDGTVKRGRGRPPAQRNLAPVYLVKPEEESIHVTGEIDDIDEGISAVFRGEDFRPELDDEE